MHAMWGIGVSLKDQFQDKFNLQLNFLSSKTIEIWIQMIHTSFDTWFVLVWEITQIDTL